MPLLDLLLLTFVLATLSAVAIARVARVLPTRGRGRSTTRNSLPLPSGGNRNPAGDPPAPDNFKGILVYHDGPVQFVPANHATS